VLHPVLHLLATRPQWLAEHAEAYAQLAAVELADAAAWGRRTLLLGAAALCAAGVAATLAGVALMLWATTPDLPPRTAWLLWATPSAPLGLAVLALLAQRRRRPAERFAELQRQLQADLALLREAAAP
jgi:hypothetical protein